MNVGLKLICIMFLVMAYGWFMGYVSEQSTSNKWKEESVKSGHAEYYLDKDNNKQWRWLPIKFKPGYHHYLQKDGTYDIVPFTEEELKFMKENKL